MDNQFWKALVTLFGIGAAISLAKSLKVKKRWQEIISDMIISGFLATGAAMIIVWMPQVPFIAVAGIAAILAVLGTAFLGEKIEEAIDASIDKFLRKPKDGSEL